MKEWKPTLAFLVVCSLVTGQLAAQCGPPPNYCYIRELSAAQSSDCGECDDDWNCISGTYDVPQYYKCANAGTGEQGRVECNITMQQIATYYPCEESINWTGFIGCAAGVLGAAACCLPCIADPTKLSCAACAVCIVAAGGNCAIQDFCDCEKGDSQSTWRGVFSSLSGDYCEGS
jgi:hypothetical protein